MRDERRGGDIMPGRGVREGAQVTLRVHGATHLHETGQFFLNWHAVRGGSCMLVVEVRGMVWGKVSKKLLLAQPNRSRSSVHEKNTPATFTPPPGASAHVPVLCGPSVHCILRWLCIKLLFIRGSESVSDAPVFIQSYRWRNISPAPIMSGWCVAVCASP